MDDATVERLAHQCPSCGRATPLTSYGPEPSLCVECQRSFGLLREEAPVEVEPPSGDDPPWGMLEAFGLLVASLLALLAAEIGAVVYVTLAARAGHPIPVGDAYLSDPTLTLVRICASGVGHAITLGLAYWIVTGGGRDPFLRTMGWGWRKGFGRATVLVAFGAVFLTNVGLAEVFDHYKLTPDSTPFDELLRMSASTRIAIGIFAVVSAPFVEEVVFRGVLYPAVARRAGRMFAIAFVSTIFLLVHAEQYAGEIAYLLPLGLLSVVLTALRAYSGSLLPSFALHLLFNLVQVVIILAAGGKA